jgi:hypothetical protein
MIYVTLEMSPFIPFALEKSFLAPEILDWESNMELNLGQAGTLKRIYMSYTPTSFVPKPLLEDTGKEMFKNLTTVS